MSSLHETRTVGAPQRTAARFLERFLKQRSNLSGGAAVMPLRAPVAVPGLPDLVLARDVVMELIALPDDHSMIQRYAVTWAPKDGGSFPRFTGTLGVRGDDDERSTLDLKGSYEPPLGVGGHTFDFALGNRIACATARDLLNEMGRFIESEYKREEAVKATRRAGIGMG